MKKEKEDVKNFGNYQAKFRTMFDKDTDEAIKLKINFAKDLRELISKVCLNKKVNFEVSLGQDNGGKNKSLKSERYMVKRIAYSGLYGNYKDLMFITDLVDSGEIIIDIYDVNVLHSVIDDIKTSIKVFLEIVTRFSDLNITMTYNLEH